MTGQPPATLLARESWQLGFDAMRTMPQLFGGTFALLVAFGAAFRWQHPPGAEPITLARDLLGYASDIATEIIIAGAMIAVYRSVLLRETRDRQVWELPPNYDRFLVWTLLLNLPVLPAVVIQGLGGTPKAAPTVASLAALAAFTMAIALMIRLTALLPALAADAPGADVRGAWAASRGHAWRFIVVALLTFLPLELAAYASERLIEGIEGPGLFLLRAAFDAAKALVLGAIGAAMWSRLVEVYGASLLRPAGPW